jgi:hypothetical protein
MCSNKTQYGRLMSKKPSESSIAPLGNSIYVRPLFDSGSTQTLENNINPHFLPSHNRKKQIEKNFNTFYC